MGLWSGIFLWVQFQKIGEFGRARGKVFTLKNRDLKSDFFNVANTFFLLQEQSPKAYKQTKEKNLFHVQPLTMFFIFIFFPILG